MGVTFKSADCLPSMMLGSFAVETQTLLWWPIPQHWGIQQFLTIGNLTEQALHLILGIFFPLGMWSTLYGSDSSYIHI